MIQNLRSRLRYLVATTICALVAAPALIAGTTPTAGAATPGSLTGLLRVGGEANDGADTNLWRLYGDAYSDLRTVIVDPSNFGSGGTVNRGRFEIAPTGITTVTTPALADLDVFFGGIPRDGWSGTESTAIQNFVLNGGGLVLNLNQAGFGDVPAWLSSMITLNSTRAFYGPSACSTVVSDAAPVQPTSVGGSHPIIDTGPFGASGPLTMYHTANTMSVSGAATARYNVTISNTPAQVGIDGPFGPVSVPFTIETAVINQAKVVSVDFTDGPGGPAIGTTDSTFPFTANVAAMTAGAHTLTAIANLVGGGTITSSSVIDVQAGAVPAAYRACPGSIDHLFGTGAETVNNDISGTTVATIEPGELGAGSGPVIVTTDLDFYSSIFPLGETTITANRKFALNSFAWMINSIVPVKIPDTYFALSNPIRVYDSRLGGVGPVPTGSSRAVKVAGVTVDNITVPPEATSIIANVTAVAPDEAGFLTVYPSGSAPPTETSTHNFGKGETFANTVVMAVGASGNISVLNQFYAGTGATHVLVDVIGYSRSIGTGSHLRTISPIRALDSRIGVGTSNEPFHAGLSRDLTIVGQPGIPGNVQSVILNMTVAEATTTGSFVTVWPSGEPQPGISNINIIAGITRPNLVVARVGSNGKISIENEFGDTEILADIVGYFEPGGTGGSITGKNPTREFNSRLTTPFGPGESRQMTIQGLSGIPAEAKTVILKVTAASPTADGGYLTVWPSSGAVIGAPPNISNLNFNAGMNIPNLVITQIGSDGKINIFNAFGSTDVLVDVLGYAD